jgi:hypothetical protein
MICKNNQLFCTTGAGMVLTVGEEMVIWEMAVVRRDRHKHDVVIPNGVRELKENSLQ